MTQQNLPVFRFIDGKLVKVGMEKDVRDPSKRYGLFIANGEAYLREFSEEEERQRDREEEQWRREEPLRKAKEEENSRIVEEFKKSLKYDVRLVGFFDILGWSDSVKNSTNDKKLTEKLGLSIDAIHKQIEMYEWLEKVSNGQSHSGDPQISQFSDCLLISTTPNYSGQSTILSILNFLSSVLLYNGFLLRGGITIGPIYHKGSSVYGPALLRAYELESKCAIYPRIILDFNLAKSWGQGVKSFDSNGNQIGQARTWRLSHDGFRFFDFLQPFNGMPEFKDSGNLIKYHLVPLKNILIEALEKYKGNPKILPKYIWLSNYFNEVCREHKGHDVEPIIVEQNDI